MESQWQRFQPKGWDGYSLIDSGNGQKLERFGAVTVIRPEVTAIWHPALSRGEWKQAAHAEFVQDGARSGKWKTYQKVPEQWTVAYNSKPLRLNFKLQLTRFKHLGLFPEQADNWHFIHEQIQRIGPKAKVLNLFAYTGGASLAAKAAGAEVTHVDSIRQVVDWTRENMELSKLDGIRWVVEDALKFVQREAKRGNRYHGIIMDPPTYGIIPGKGNKKWKLEDQLYTLLETTGQLLEREHFLVLNTYSGLANSTLETLVRQTMPVQHTACGDLVLQSESGQLLPTGSCLRAWNAE
jgi:23S rRNA (cytosine1962-C5)-methyltransferase